ncbi:multidrug resistance protein B [Nocardioides baekrokdamisoli]|uniref:Multidrug resistance protein B n=1 Tax=Nocardioides baekrokdamisoli TaxID=1804624 RepID=A0A3G9IEJ8_9ACTN|nr:DHA2 family efflux MFS transporter permease subunit [Nocardioides baekrokdamisoli]BBH17337.1 multidrug resistance protein B [Nocardioides baekrokdamisoli]
MTTAVKTPDAADAALPAADEGFSKHVWLTAGVIVLGAIMSILDMTVVSVAQQKFIDVFHSNQAQVAWTVTGYTLALAAVIPLTGWAADRFGTKRLYLIAIAAFAVGSALCAAATTLPMLVAFRVLQGLGGGMLMPLGMTIMTKAAGPDKVGRIMAVLGIPMMVGPIAGPILGGWLIDAASWQWIFLINIPVGIAAFVYSLAVLEKDDPKPSESFDFVGMLLLSPGLATLLYGISSIPEKGTFFTPKVEIFTAIGAVLTIAFIPWALRKKNIHPLMDLRLFKNKEMTIAAVSMTLFMLAFMGASLLFPQYFQFVRHENSLHAGLMLAPQAVGSMLTMPIAGIISDKRGPGKVVLVGIVVTVAGLAMFSMLTDTTPYWYLLLALFIMGLGMGSTMMPIFSAALATLRDATIARGSTLTNIIQQVAASIGTAIFAVVLTNGLRAKGLGQGMTPTGTNPLHDMAHAYSSTMWIATILVALVFIPALFLPRTKIENPDAANIPMGH